MYFTFYNLLVAQCAMHIAHMYINALSFVFLKEDAQISAQFKFGVSAGEIGIWYSRSYQNDTLTV